MTRRQEMLYWIERGKKLGMHPQYTHGFRTMLHWLDEIGER
jgi:hypothetical protein